MRRAISWLLAGLPFDARSRRAIDETLLDWEGEATDAKTFSEATVTELRGVTSIARVASLSVLRESIDFRWCRGLGRRFAVAGAVIMALAIVLTATVTGDFAIKLRTLLWFVPTVATVALPAALFLIVAWRPSGRNVPSLGASWIASITAVIGLQLVTVLAGEMYLFLMYRDLGAVGLERHAARLWVWPQPRALLGVVGWWAVAGSAVVLAASLAKRAGLQSRWWLVSVPLFALIVPRTLSFAIEKTFLYLGVLWYREFAGLLGAFLLSAALMLLTAAYGPRTQATGPDSTHDAV